MKKNLEILWLFLAVCGISMGVSSCKDDGGDEPDTTEAYVYTPTDLEETITDDNYVSFTWSDKSATSADIYVFEIYKGTSVDEGEQLISESISADSKSYSYDDALLSGVSYVARVKGSMSDGSADDSDWATVSFTANVLDVSADFQDGDITSSSVTIRWTAGFEATSIVVYNEAGEEVSTHTITSDEITAGAATISELTENTSYTATLYQGESVVGEYSFMTEIEGGISVTSDEELAAAITAAVDGDIIVLDTTETSTYTLDAEISANITIRGRNEGSVPTVKMSLTMQESYAGLTLMYLKLDGNSEVENMISLAEHAEDCDATIFQITDGTGQFVGGEISIIDCEIYNYTRVLYASKKTYQTVAVFTIEGTIVGGVTGNIIDTRLWNEAGFCSTGDGNPFRGSAILSTVINNSTIYNCASDGESSLIRLDDTNYMLGGVACTFTMTNSTLYNVAAGYLMYNIAYGKIDEEGEMTITSCLFAETDAVNGNSRSVQKAALFTSNEYSNATGLSTEAGTNSNANSRTIFDSTGSNITATFTDAANGDFTVSGATVGDPRWLQ